MPTNINVTWINAFRIFGWNGFVENLRSPFIADHPPWNGVSTGIVSTKLTHRPRFHLLYRVSTIHPAIRSQGSKQRGGKATCRSSPPRFSIPFARSTRYPRGNPFPARSTFSFCRLFSPFPTTPFLCDTRPSSRGGGGGGGGGGMFSNHGSAPRFYAASFLRLFAPGAMRSCIDYSLVITFACGRI